MNSPPSLQRLRTATTYCPVQLVQQIQYGNRGVRLPRVRHEAFHQDGGVAQSGQAVLLDRSGVRHCHSHTGPIFANTSLSMKT